MLINVGVHIPKSWVSQSAYVCTWQDLVGGRGRRHDSWTTCIYLQYHMYDVLTFLMNYTIHSGFTVQTFDISHGCDTIKFENWHIWTYMAARFILVGYRMDRSICSCSSNMMQWLHSSGLRLCQMEDGYCLQWIKWYDHGMQHDMCLVNKILIYIFSKGNSSI